MEVYAGFLEHTDHHVGRLIDALEDLEVLDDTLVYYIVGDNGASAEGTLKGTFNETIVAQRGGGDRDDRVHGVADRPVRHGRGRTTTTRSAGRTRWTRPTSGPSRSPRTGAAPATARSSTGPNGFTAAGEVRAQFSHVIDVAATVLDAAGLPAPTFVHGVQQMPLHGMSMVHTFDDAGGTGAPRDPVLRDVREPRHLPQGLDRGAPATARPWVADRRRPRIDDDVWELYAPDDWTQAHDLAAEQPEKLAELQRLFLIEAARYNVLPLDDRRVERFNADIAGRPQLVNGNSQLLFEGMGRLSENSVIVIKNKSHAVTAEIEVPDGGAEGVIVAQGGAFAGWSLYLQEGRPAYCYNLFGLQRFKIYGRASVARRASTRCAWSSPTTAAASPRAATSTLYVDGDKVGEGRVEHTVPMLFSGRRDHRPRPRQRHPRQRRLRPSDNAFTGRVRWVQIDIDEAAEDVDHLISPEERLRVAMARQ